MTREPMVGVMFDPARLLFRKEWYFKLLPWLADWGYNTVMLNLADDAACTLEFQRHPELASAHAFSQDEMRRFVRAAGRRHIQVIPFLPSFGHTGYIHRRRAYRHLRNGRVRRHLCPAHPDTRRLLADLWAELAALFPAPWAHVGLDEFGPMPDPSCAACTARFAGIPRWRIYAEHVQWLRDLLAARGKRIMLWNEFPQGHWKQADVASALPRDIVLTLEWDSPDSTRFYLDQGFDVVGAFPYLTSYPGTTILPNYGQNMIHAPWSVDLARYGSQILGKLVPVWENTYTLFGAPLYGIARAADQIRIPGGTPGFGPSFCERFFKCQDGPTIARLLDELHRHAPQFNVFTGANNHYLTIESQDGPLINLFGHADANQLTAARIERGLDLARHAQSVGAGLRRARRQVARHKALYDVYLLAADLTRHIGGRGRLMQELCDTLEAARQAAAAGDRRRARRLRIGIRNALRRAASESRALLERVERNWDLGYYPDHPFRDPSLRQPGVEDGLLTDDAWSDKELRLGATHIHASVAWSTQYLERLARRAEALAAGLQDFAGLGPIPRPVPPPPAVTAFATRWRISGVRPAPASLEDLALPAAPDMTPREWPKGCVDLREDLFAAPEDRMVYLACRFECPEPMALSLGLGYDGPVKLWLDGRDLFCDPAGAVPIGVDKANLPVEAAAGRHEVFIALTSNRGTAAGLRLRAFRRDVTPAQLEAGPGAYTLPNLME